MRLLEMQARAHDSAEKKGSFDMENEVYAKTSRGVVAEFVESGGKGAGVPSKELSEVLDLFSCQRIMLAVSKLGNAVEALQGSECGKHEEALADAVIRILEHCQSRGINLEYEIKKKMAKDKKK